MEPNADLAKQLAVISIIGSVAVYQSGLNPIPYFIVSELFTQGTVDTANIITGPVNRLTNFIVVCTFPVLNKMLFPYILLLYAAFLVFFFIAIYIFLPETKDRPVADISNEIHGGTSSFFSLTRTTFYQPLEEEEQ